MRTHRRARTLLAMLAVALAGSAQAGFALVAGGGAAGRATADLGPRAAERAAWRIGHMDAHCRVRRRARRYSCSAELTCPRGRVSEVDYTFVLRGTQTIEGATRTVVAGLPRARDC